MHAASCWQGWIQSGSRYVSRIDGKHVNKIADMYAYKGDAVRVVMCTWMGDVRQATDRERTWWDMSERQRARGTQTPHADNRTASEGTGTTNGGTTV